MRLVLQRVSRAAVSVGCEVISSIGNGLLALVGVEDADGDEDIEWLVRKVAGLRIFDDDEGVMNLSVMDVGGEILVVSQFTLMAQCKKGMRPSYVRAAGHPVAIPLYERFCERLSEAMGKPVGRGRFGADMRIDMLCRGPVTICLDSKMRDL